MELWSTVSSHQLFYFLLKCCCRRGKLLFRIISTKDLKLQELKLHVLSRMIIQYRMICLKATFCYFLSNVFIREQTSLEEGEIPWLQYNEVNESSSDEGNEPANEFAQPEAFMLDGNNNLEDDSSVSEDLDVDWRYVVVSLHVTTCSVPHPAELGWVCHCMLCYSLSELWWERWLLGMIGVFQSHFRCLFPPFLTHLLDEEGHLLVPGHRASLD